MTAPTFANFDLLIERGAQGYRARVIRSLAGEATGQFAWPFSESDRARYAQGAANADALPTDAQEFGSRLFQAIFGGDVGICLRRSLDEALRRQVGLRIRLRFDRDVPELANLPWEYLYAEAEQRFLALSDATPVVRYLELSQAAPLLPVAPPLTVLAVLANPKGAPPLDVEREWGLLRQATADLTQRQVIRLERLPAATLDALQVRLRQGPVHVLHFVGHGFFDAGQNLGGTLFEDANGYPNWVPARNLSILLADHRALRLVFLNACRSAAGSDGAAFTGAAQTLVSEGVPAVLAMQFAVSDAAAIALSHEFYRALADGYPAEAALSEARKAIAARGNPLEWATPVLFTRSDDNRLIELPGKGEEAEPGGTQAIRVPPPPGPVPLPDVSGFVGRERELAYFASILDAAHFAIIAGMPGVGKTTLAARLAHQAAADPARILWHRFHEGESIEAIIWQLAGLMARNGQGELWEMLQAAAQSGGKPPPTPVLLDYVFQLVRGRGYVICLDDFHHVEDDPLVTAFRERLQALLPAGEITLIITSREAPAYVTTVKFEPLEGLDLAGTAQLLAARGVTLPPDLAAELHRRTDGNAELVTLAVEALRRATRPERVIERLVEEEDVAGFLLKEVDRQLQPEEKTIMSGVAVLLDHPGTRDAIEATLDTGGVRRTLHYLSNRYLLLEIEGRRDREYTQHAFLRAFYYDLLGRRERQAMHRRAGAYYEREEPDLLRAAVHYHRAGEYDHAAGLAAADIWASVNRGEAGPLRRLLEALEQSALSPEMRLSVLVASGDLLAFLGESAAAKQRYQAALADLQGLPTTPTRAAWEARACLGMGAALEHQTPDEALRWLEQGLAAAGGDAALQAALLNRVGAVHVGLAEYDAAIASLEQALSLLPATISQLRANVLGNLSTAHAWSGNTAASSRYAGQALELSRQLHDLYGLSSLLSNSAIDKEIAGDWTNAAADYQEALKLAEQLGSLFEQAHIHNLLGTLRLHQGDEATAENHLRCAADLFRRIANPEYLAATLPVLAQLHLRRQDFGAARAALAEAETLATGGGWDYILPETLTTQAELVLAEGDPVAAQDRSERAIAVAAELAQAVDEGKAWRAKGLALAAAGRMDEALGAFERSLALLTEQDPYETARAQLAYARALAAAGETERSTELMREAEAVLERLGAPAQS